MEFPQWAVPFRDNPEWRKSFNSWIDAAVNQYAKTALLAADSMDTLLGLRYAVGELEALRAMINYQDEEVQRQKEKMNNVTA